MYCHIRYTATICLLKGALNSMILEDKTTCAFVQNRGRGGALSFRIGREACPIFLGPKILSRLIFLDLIFCPFKFIFLGSHVAENLYF